MSHEICLAILRRHHEETSCKKLQKPLPKVEPFSAFCPCLSTTLAGARYPYVTLAILKKSRATFFAELRDKLHEIFFLFGAFVSKRLLT